MSDSGDNGCSSSSSSSFSCSSSSRSIDNSCSSRSNWRGWGPMAVSRLPFSQGCETMTTTADRDDESRTTSCRCCGRCDADDNSSSKCSSSSNSSRSSSGYSKSSRASSSSRSSNSTNRDRSSSGMRRPCSPALLADGRLLLPLLMLLVVVGCSGGNTLLCGASVVSVVASASEPRRPGAEDVLPPPFLATPSPSSSSSRRASASSLSSSPFSSSSTSPSTLAWILLGPVPREHKQHLQRQEKEEQQQEEEQRQGEEERQEEQQRQEEQGQGRRGMLAQMRKRPRPQTKAVRASKPRSLRPPAAPVVVRRPAGKPRPRSSGAPVGKRPPPLASKASPPKPKPAPVPKPKPKGRPTGAATPPPRAPPPRAQGGVEPAAVLQLLRRNATRGRCLDGSLPGYYLRRGYGTGANKWHIILEGGGWCFSVRQCSGRSRGRLGSSREWTPRWRRLTGIASGRAAVNPDFFNWNTVLVKYCDGGSFAGSFGKHKRQPKPVFFSGHFNLEGVLRDMLETKGLARAQQVLVGGCSAGAHAVALACDNIATYLAINGANNTKCYMDAGLFMDAADINGQRSFRRLVQGMVNFQNMVRLGLNVDCRRVFRRVNQTWRCWFPQYSLEYVRTPIFIVNSDFDYKAIALTLAPHTRRTPANVAAGSARLGASATSGVAASKAGTQQRRRRRRQGRQLAKVVRKQVLGKKVPALRCINTKQGLASCTPRVRARVAYYRGSVRAAMKYLAVRAHERGDNARVFPMSQRTHCVLGWDEGWQSTRSSNPSLPLLRMAFRQWYFGGTGRRT